ncbi:hypothetical protein CBM2631_A80003 [Cupriavidus taiwanensis]|nr:hypothetical protein CBM2588_A40097 [Cupriavidus taiwanensis]SOY88512.1 hypothetical protein CBM2591_A60002 [Cupriavidus taiwanensis]SOZ61324.1 hypothetical protein CBM2617_A40067 [Cupriavidus taiwanensis]SOZ81407.1 hypothetical protein CBM2618_A50067 [Cupriavidus taiwanensis]SOZ82549.1 hypothetical protein CBM2622_A50070 [Cupriavidus taiwanensis]
MCCDGRREFGKRMDAATLYQQLFSAAHRLFALEGEGVIRELAVEAWIGREAISALFEWRIVAVSANVDIALDSLMGQRVTLLTTLAGGGQSRRTGLIRQAEKLGADGSLARYRLTVIPWLWLTTQQRDSQVFQNRTLDSIIEAVLQDYAPYAHWRYAAGAEARIAAFGERDHIAQFRETDYQFLSRLLAEAGLGYTVVEDDEAPFGHAVVIFADSAQLPEDSESAVGGGIRYHRAHSQKSADAIQQLICETRAAVGGSNHRRADAQLLRRRGRAAVADPSPAGGSSGTRPCGALPCLRCASAVARRRAGGRLPAPVQPSYPAGRAYRNRGRTGRSDAAGRQRRTPRQPARADPRALPVAARRARRRSQQPLAARGTAPGGGRHGLAMAAAHRPGGAGQVCRQRYRPAVRDRRAVQRPGRSRHRAHAGRQVNGRHHVLPAV